MTAEPHFSRRPDPSSGNLTAQGPAGSPEDVQAQPVTAEALLLGSGGGEPLSELLRPGKAGSNTAADHVAVLDAALASVFHRG